MFLKDISITNFRNHQKTKISLAQNINIIYGNNGQGKTNILESIYVLGLTKSHRSFIDDNLIKNGEEVAIIKGTIKTDISYALELIINKTSKKMKIDNFPISKVGDYIQKMNIIIFYAEDLELIRGVPGVRRKYLNTELGQLSANYYNVTNQFNKILKTRNEYLKKISNNELVDMNYFEILTDYFVEKSIFLYRMRKQYIDKLNNYCNEIFKSLSGLEGFTLKYETSNDFSSFDRETIKNDLYHSLKDNYDKEVKFKTTLYGPHKDDFVFYLNDMNLRNYGSQGQQRMAVLSLKLAEIEIFKDFKQTSPIILLDDVFSELDNKKKNNLLKFIDNGMQVIITTTDLKNISKKITQKAKLIKVNNGKIEKGDKNGRK